MMTQTHMLLSATFFAKPGHYGRTAAALMGGVVPDAAIFVMYGWEKLKCTSDQIIWNDIYFNSTFWKDAVAWGNSAPLYIALLAIGALVYRASRLMGTILMVLAASCLLHLAGDFFLHVDDAHRHFFPVSDYKFISAVSYWDPAHYGSYWSVFEVFLGLALSIILFRRFKSIPSRLALGCLIAAYVAVPAYFLWSLS